MLPGIWQRPWALSALLCCSPLFAATSLPEAGFSELLRSSTSFANREEAETAQQELWQRYLTSVHGDAPRYEQHRQRALHYGDKVMKFSLELRGPKPVDGYPVYIALHGGGSAPAWVNDGQWEHMKTYYRDSVDSGIYLAPRGVSDTWNLHFVEESYPLYDGLIENLIAYEGADPNRIYLLGFSAGGDGVYQVVPRMANRFAAANMSAGHHNGISFTNLFNTPFLLQVGERDNAFQRNRVTAENYLALTGLQYLAEGGYTHELFMHANAWHNGWADNDPRGGQHPIIKDPRAWLNHNDRATTTAETNGVHWLRNYVRSPRPERLIWDLGTRAKRGTGWGGNYAGDVKLSEQQNIFSWVSNDTPPAPGARLEIRRIPGKNTIVIDQAKALTQFRILLHRGDFDFSAPIRVLYQGQQIAEFHPEHRLQVMARTLLESGDPSTIFDDEISVVIPAAE